MSDISSWFSVKLIQRRYKLDMKVMYTYVYVTTYLLFYPSCIMFIENLHISLECTLYSGTIYLRGLIHQLGNPLICLTLPLPPIINLNTKTKDYALINIPFYLLYQNISLCNSFAIIDQFSRQFSLNMICILKQISLKIQIPDISTIKEC